MGTQSSKAKVNPRVLKLPTADNTLRILIVDYSGLRIVLDNNVSDNSFIIGNISRHYRQNRIIGRRLRGGAFLQAVTRNFLVT